FLRHIVFAPGAMISLPQIFLSSFVLLLPFCILVGFVFTLLSYVISTVYDKNLISKVYSWESTGSIVGGVLFNLVVVWFLQTFQSLLLLVALTFAVVFYVSLSLRYRILVFVVPLVLAGVLAAGWILDPGKSARSYLFDGQELKHYKSTPYGNIAVTESQDQLNYYENNLLLFTSNQPVANEETVHYPMVQHEQPGRVLLLSGGTPGVVKEILKYPVERIDYVEINPFLIQAVSKYSDVYDRPEVRVINRDARLYLRRTGRKYDVVIINLPEPSTVQLNRFYTKQFYSELKDHLNPGAVISFGVSGSSNYMSEEAVHLNSSLYNTLKSQFGHVIILPGNRNYFVASDKPLSYQISDLTQKKRLDNQYVNRYYIQDDLLKRRGEVILNNLTAGAAVNKDFKPVTYMLNVQYWLSQFSFNYWLPLVIIALLSLLLLIRMHPVNVGMFLGGFAGASIEVVLLVVFQILYGYVYNIVGIIVTVFMAGLAFGTCYRERFIPKTNVSGYYKIQFTLGIFAMLLPLIFLLLKHFLVPAFLIHTLFIILMFLTSVLVGMIFSIASQLRLKKLVQIASDVYGVDLLGAAIGSFLVTVYLIPVLGVLNVCFIVGGLNILSGVLTMGRLSSN
ncbi:MAG: fused MFS/spermidine synthase, partial [Bacteroidota bacterium]